MKTQQIVRCPNCGSMAQRYFWIDRPIHEKCFRDNCLTRIECLTCDYFLMTHSQTGKVIESYAPGIPIECDRRYLQATEEQEKCSAIVTI